ncbi:putative multicatalytic endopeptidase complex chain PRE1 [Violaceomyces palustris]|uniref:Multicatalytic endopeptidase complex chain PRE1 n=1 Tax=Violaceomyces palustris TaxID=1673888 RepID=A0ACD0NSW6_9BASI|nr:putative multicatalytic endopeptidase complex chain PRE1 [Violaceomyces palustris]
MECSFGITGKGYTIIASDSNAARSIVKMKTDEDKQKVLSDHLVMTYSGESGDTLQFSEYIERNLRLYGIRNHVELRPRAAASWIRAQIADSLRTRNAYQVNLLLGGFDLPTSEPALYWVDYLGTLATVPFAAHGYGAFFALSTLDRYHRPDMSLEEGLDLLRRCINELKTRFIVDLGTFKVRVVDREGVREVKL